MEAYPDSYIGPSTRLSELAADYTLNTKLKIYCEQVREWILKPAEELLGSDRARHNGMAVLALLMSFFEPHGCYLHGGFVKKKIKDDDGSGKPQYRHDDDAEFRLAFNALKASFPQGTSAPPGTCQTLWELGRCGLFHLGTTKPKLLVDVHDDDQPFATKSVALDDGNSRDLLVVNPRALASRIRTYLEKYERRVSAKTKHHGEFGTFFDCLYEGAVKEFRSIGAHETVQVDTVATGSCEANPWK